MTTEKELEVQGKPMKILMDLGKNDRIVIIDIDNTLSNCKHRTHHVEGMTPDWDAFFGELEKDPPNEWCVNLCRIYSNAGYSVKLVSGRPNEYRMKTMEWLEKHGVPWSQLYMRTNGDRRADDIVKKEILHAHFDKSKVEFVVDDRPPVIKMWREEGLTCLQCV